MFAVSGEGTQPDDRFWGGSRMSGGSSSQHWRVAHRGGATTTSVGRQRRRGLVWRLKTSEKVGQMGCKAWWAGWAKYRYEIG
jgi:hypothetical protein